MVIAGDVYDGDWKASILGCFSSARWAGSDTRGYSVYLLYGNHDADSEMTRGLELPDNVYVFSSRKAETFASKTRRSLCMEPQLQSGGYH